MKKLLWMLFILLLLGLGFLYIVKNPELPISQTILKAIGLERLIISDEPIAMGTGTFNLDEIGATFTLPQGRELQSTPTQEGEKTKFIITTPEKDKRGYQVIIRGSLAKTTSSGADIMARFNLPTIPQDNETFPIDCSGAFTQVCMGTYMSGIVYALVFEGASEVPQQTDLLFSERVPRHEEVKQAMKDMVASVIIVPMTGAELTGSEYSIKDGALYFGSNKLYGDTFKACTVDYGQEGFEAINILFENEDYLIFNVLEGPCGGDPWIGSMLLQKKDNVSNLIIIGNNFYEYEKVEGDIMYLNEYTGQIPLNPGIEIQTKGYYENFDCPECGIVFLKTIQINIHDIARYITGSVYFPKLIP